MWTHDGRAMPRDWRQRRHQAWLTAPRDSAGNVLCGLCDQPIRRGQPYEVDHVLDKDDHRVESLRVVHPACHKIRTQEQAIEARQPQEPDPLPHPRAQLRRAWSRWDNE